MKSIDSSQRKIMKLMFLLNFVKFWNQISLINFEGWWNKNIWHVNEIFKLLFICSNNKKLNSNLSETH